MTDDWSMNDPSLYLPETSPTNPSYVARVFLTLLLQEDLDVATLEQVVTSQSRHDWGDFTSARDYMRSIDQPGISSKNSRAVNARDVAYVPILGDVSAAYTVPGGTPTFPEAVVTLVWYGDRGTWLVHSIGDFVRPNGLIRPSIGEAPEGMA